MPTVSVIIPVYNVEKYLHRCVDSVLNQTFTDFECILVDDGSPDRCPQICDEYAKKDKRIKVIHKQNKGPSDARNAGLDIAIGNYIYFVDGDDYVELSLLERLLEEIRNSGADVIAFGYRKEYEDTNLSCDVKFMPFEYKLESQQDYLDFICKIVLPRTVNWEVCFKLFKTSIIRENQVKFCNKSNIAEDLHFFLCYLLSTKKVKVIDDVLYHYTRQSNSITHSIIKPRINEYVDLNENFYNYIRYKGYRFLIDRYYMLFYIIMSNAYWQFNNNDIQESMIGVENKYFLRKNLIRIVMNAKEMSIYFDTNKNNIICENANFLLHTSNTIIFKICRKILKGIILLKKKHNE